MRAGSRASSYGPGATATSTRTIVEQAEEQLTADAGRVAAAGDHPRRPPAIDAYEYEDFVLHGYVAQPHIKAAVAV